MRLRSTVVRAAALIALVLGLMTGCGGDDSSSVAVPYVIGLEESLAVRVAEEAGLTPRMAYTSTAKIHQGFVYSQSPAEGSMTNENAVLLIRISSGPADPARATVGNRGTRVLVTEQDRTILASSRSGFTGEMFLLGSEAGRDFYRVPKTDGSDCFAASTTGSAHRLGALVCSPDFPTERLVLDMSVVGADRPEAQLKVMSIQGVAADEVAEVRVLSRTNETLATIPVVGNVFAALVTPNAGHVGAVVAVSEDGAVLYRSHIGGG